MTLEDSLRAENLSPDTRTLERLQRYTDMLLEWNGVHNLTGARSRREVEENIVDSLGPLGFLELPAPVLDVGTGAGFPGLILAIARPETETILCEPRNKRAAFLNYAVRRLDLPRVRVVRRRVEELQAPTPALITSRAVSDTALLLELTAHLRDRHTRYLLYKGGRVHDEVAKVPPGFDARIVRRDRRRYLMLVPAEHGARQAGKMLS